MNDLQRLLDERLSDRYQLQRQLGKQVGRQTWLALDRSTETPVVIKILSLGQNFQWQDLKLFEREAQTLQTLSHPSIPRYLDYLDIQTSNFKGFALVQSYIEGRSPEDHLKAGRTFSEAEVKYLAEQLLEILLDLHQQSPPIIHRDIKPNNILLNDATQPPAIYLVDFGSVQHLAAREGGTITVVGTYGYMPPEQFGGQVVPASDLYSLGATLIFLVTGRHPTELSQTNLHLQFRHLTQLSSDFADWLEWLTEPGCDRRPVSAQDALRALQKPDRYLKTPLQNKPEFSDITLTQTDRSLKIVLPAPGLGWATIGWFALAAPLWVWTISVLIHLTQTHPSSLKLGLRLLLLISTPIVSGGLAIAVCRNLTTVHIKITQQYIILGYKIFGIYYKRRSLPRAKVRELWISDFYRKNQTNLMLETTQGLKPWNLGRLEPEEVTWLSQRLDHFFRSEP